MTPEKKKQYFVLVGFFALCFGVSSIGGVITAGSVNGWYQTLAKPGFNPPDWIFAPVWATLYGMMAIAGWLVWRAHGVKAAWIAHLAFLVQLGLNLLWSYLFFGLQELGLAFGEILVLFSAILTTLILFWRLNPLAGLLFVPYTLWVSFAAVLNAAIWRMN